MTTVADITTATPNGPVTGVSFPVIPLQLRVSGDFDGAYIVIEASDGGELNYVPMTKLEDCNILKLDHPGRFQIHGLDGDYLRVVLYHRGPNTEIQVEALP